MRFAIITFAALIGLPGAVLAQSGKAEVHTVATVRIPDVLHLQASSTSELTDAAGRSVTRAGLRVTANREWVLTLGSNAIDQVEQIVVGGQVLNGAAIAAGRGGNAIPVELEIHWKQRPATATPAQVVYHLAAR